MALIGVDLLPILSAPFCKVVLMVLLALMVVAPLKAPLTFAVPLKDCPQMVLAV